MTERTETHIEESPGRRRCVAFAGGRRIARGEIADVAVRVKAAIDGGEEGSVLCFDEHTSEPVELDLRGTDEEIRRRLDGGREPSAPRSPGRPRLGVVAREVTLLPRHWEWLSEQPGGASVALRRLVEAARRQPDPEASRRRDLESVYRFISAMAGNERGFEEAARALFGGRRARFERETASWPADVREHARWLARGVFDAEGGRDAARPDPERSWPS